MQSTGQSTGNPQGDSDSIEHHVRLCIGCEKMVLEAQVMWTLGTRETVHVVLELDRNAYPAILRFTLGEDGLLVPQDGGALVEHSATECWFVLERQ